MGLWQRQLLCPQAHLAADRPLVSLSSASPNPEADNHPQLLLEIEWKKIPSGLQRDVHAELDI